MSRNPRKYRVLVAGEHTFIWRTTHCHVRGCEDILTIRRSGTPSGRALHFGDKPGFLPSGGAYSEAGVVADDKRRWLNLNEPGVVRAFIDALCEAGWQATDRSYLHVDGWEWFDQCCLRHESAEGGDQNSDRRASSTST